MTFLEAIARMEGFYSKGTRPNRNHNPGDIQYGKFAAAHGALASDGRFAIFPDDETGFAAMKALLSGPSYEGMTVEEALNKWAPPVENDVSAYLENVCKWVGCQPSDLIGPLLEAS